MDAPTIPDEAQDLLTLLQGDGDLRVWSVIVTIMGDMARGPEQTVSGATLGVLMGALGIRPEATRVALHRLRKDGWISSQRAGRGSLYALTDDGRAQTRAVADRIYDPNPPVPDRWHLVVTSTTTDPDSVAQHLVKQGFSELSPNVFLGVSDPGACPGCLHFSDHTPKLPQTMLNTLVPAPAAAETQRFQARLAQVSPRILSPQSPLSSLSKAALRIIVLHNWRRIVLRWPPLPLPTTWPEAQLRRDVHAILTRLGPIDADALRG
ncbi:hypothetical protein MUY21_01370 [Aliiroseovarius sp. S2029]|uniref:hypothetical protein n=1 Tax=Aliiroseovarius sp. S2029 TaxID=2936988 RepID=UPI0020BF5B56|nr:hypothetical protein [Aliiroseovarius sp. S2029]MCK8482676.1 hypothetical protein [Aliiroseovarius sp. S2029]